MKRNNASTKPASLGRLATLLTGAVLLLLGTPAPLAAQEAKPSSSGVPIYFTIGVGSWPIPFMPLAGQLGLTVSPPVGELTLRSFGIINSNMRGLSNNFSDIALLYGRRRVQGTVWHSAGVGPAVAWTGLEECTSFSGGGTGYISISFCDRYEVVDRHWRAGLALQSTLGWRRISVSLLGNANRVQPFVGATLNLHLGRMRLVR